MDRRTFLTVVLLGGAAIGVLFGWQIMHRPNADLDGDPLDVDRRVRFVCCNDRGHYSAGVYMRCGGGRAAFATVREAARFMRAGDPDSAAAGLCGFMFKRVGYDGDTVGTLALEPPPRPGPDGTIDWKEYGADGDVIVINVDRRTAKCCFGSVLGEEVHDLPLGGSTHK